MPNKANGCYPLDGETNPINHTKNQFLNVILMMKLSQWTLMDSQHAQPSQNLKRGNTAMKDDALNATRKGIWHATAHIQWGAKPLQCLAIFDWVRCGA